MTQETLSERGSLSKEYIVRVENALKRISLKKLFKIKK